MNLPSKNRVTNTVPGRATAVLFLVAALTTAATAAPFTPGNLVVYRIGDGLAPLNSNATGVFLDEYTPSGTFVQSIAMPTADSGSNRPLTGQGTSNSEGLLSLSPDRTFLGLTGYAAAPGLASPAGTTAATVNRVVGLVDFGGNINTTTALTDAASGGNPRAAVTTNGTDIWLSGSTGASVTPPWVQPHRRNSAQPWSI